MGIQIRGSATTTPEGLGHHEIDNDTMFRDCLHPLTRMRTISNEPCSAKRCRQFGVRQDRTRVNCKVAIGGVLSYGELGCVGMEIDGLGAY